MFEMEKIRRIYESMGKSDGGENAVQIDTGLSGDLAEDILSSVIGQMSDGLWENSPAMEHYWRFINAVRTEGDQIFLVVDGVAEDDSHVANHFNSRMGMDERKIREFVAKKLKEAVKEELKTARHSAGWDRNNESESSCLGGTISDCYFVYETLLGRKDFAKKYPASTVKAMTS